MINLAVVGSPAGNRFPVSNQMKTTERITRLNNDMWLYEIKTEDPVIMKGSFTVRYPMQNDPSYQWWEYACHEGNTIVQGYSTTNKHERENPPEEPAPAAARIPATLADKLVGRWVGKPQIPTIDYNIEIEFLKTADGEIQGKLIGTDLKTFRGKVNPAINKFLRDFRIANPPQGGRGGAGGRGGGAPAGARDGAPAAPPPPVTLDQPIQVNFQFPNTQPWTYAGTIAPDGSSITGVTNSAQGGSVLDFKKKS